MSRETLVVLDSGVLLNLVASGCAALLAEGPYRYVIPVGAHDRSIHLWINLPNEGGGDSTGEGTGPAVIEVNVSDFVARGQLAVESLDDCLDLFVNLTVPLCDSQARVLALALARDAHLATDDRRLRRVVRELGLQTTLLSTPVIVREWLTATQRSEVVARAVAQAISSRAQFVPLENDPLADWWSQLLR